MWSTISKFGSDYCDLPTMLWNSAVLLRVLTINIDPHYTKRPSIFVYLFNVVTIICYYYVFLVSMIWCFLYKAQTGEKVDAMIVFAIAVSSEIVNVKAVFMFLYKKSVNEIFDGYLSFDNLVEAGTRFSDNILKTLKHLKKRAIWFSMLIIGDGIILCIKPLLLPGRHFIEDRFIYPGLQPMLETPNYQIAYAITIAAIFQACYTQANITSFFIIVVGYTEAQMLALSQELNSLWNDAIINTEQIEDTKIREVVKNKYVKEKLKDIIQKHTVNISLLQKVEGLYRSMAVIEFILLIIGIIAALLGGLENTYIYLPFPMIQVAMDCWIGQRLIDASLVFETAVYNCKWENFDKSNMKTVLIMLIVSQKPMVLTAGGIATLNFQCLMWVIKSVYSAYTTLSTIM